MHKALLLFIIWCDSRVVACYCRNTQECRYSGFLVVGSYEGIWGSIGKIIFRFMSAGASQFNQVIAGCFSQWCSTKGSLRALQALGDPLQEVLLWALMVHGLVFPKLGSHSRDNHRITLYYSTLICKHQVVQLKRSTQHYNVITGCASAEPAELAC